MVLAKAEKALEPKTGDTKKVAFLFAGVLVIMVVGQLFAFEKFIPLIEKYELPGDYATALIIASVLVVLEVFALPFLLRMKTSRLMRVVSMVCGWMVASIWFKLTLWANLAPNSVDNIGFLGSYVLLPVGWWAVAVAGAMIILAVWTAWGMWPLARKQSKSNKSKK